MRRLRMPIGLALGIAVTIGVFAAEPLSTQASSPPITSARTFVLFNIADAQLPENMAPAPHKSLIVSLNGADQILHVSANGKVKVLAFLPQSPTKGVNTPVVHTSFQAGIVRAPNGTIYVLYSTGDAALTGIWELKPGSSTPKLIVPLPATSLGNGLALDTKTKTLYIADSTGTIWSAPESGGTATVWASGPQFQPVHFLGANGLKIHNGSVWVSSTDGADILQIPIESDGSAGPITTAVTGVPTIDDFNFVGKGNEIIAALDKDNEVVLVSPGGTPSTVLDPSDGLEGPTSIVVEGKTIYVASGAYNTGINPNILVAKLGK
jgi:hypothetical protein